MPVDPAKIIAKARAVALARVEAVAIHLVNAMRENLSVPGRTSTTTITRTGKTKVKWGPLNSAPSSADEFPRKQTGTLRSSVAYEIDRDKLAAKVGTNLKVGRWLELGTAGGVIITPKNARILADAANGRIFGTRVVQGPIVARHWALRTIKAEMPAINAIMRTGKAT